MRRRLVPHGLVSIVVLLWGALGLVAGAAVGALVHLETRPSAPGLVAYHGPYLFGPDGTTVSRAYESTLSVTYTRRPPDLTLPLGLTIGLLAGLVVGLVLSRRPKPAAIRG